MVATQLEKRRNWRLHTARPVILENATGITRDMSPSGVFFWTSGTYSPGESMNFAVELSSGGDREIQRCQGLIVRIERLAHMIGVAVTISESAIETTQT